jgi:hypothetical protein
MSDIEQKVPFMFRGSSRVYRVIGVQDSTFFGLNVNVKHGSKATRMELVFACLGTPPENTPFTSRGDTTFIVAFDAKPQGELPVVKGTYLNKDEILIGERVNAFQTADYIHKNLPAIQKWLDDILEKAGIVPAYNDVADIFSTFFGEDSPEAKFEPLVLPVLKAGGAAPVDFDFSKYGKGEPGDDPNTPPGSDDGESGPNAEDQDGDEQ